MKNKDIILDYEKQRNKILSFIPEKILKEFFLNINIKLINNELRLKREKERLANNENLNKQDNVIKYKYNRSYKDESRRSKKDFFRKS